MRDIGVAFKFPFREANWISNMLLGSLFEFLMILLMGTFFVIGYQVEVIKRVMQQDQKALPDWDRLSENFLMGQLYLASREAQTTPARG